MSADVRRLLRFLPAVFACALSVWTVGTGCGWDYAIPEADAGPGDTRAESPVDADDGGPFADAEHTLSDGRVCRGHDEDRDGVPDECDNCPNVHNPGQSGGTVGSACVPDSFFISAPERLLFDPFLSFSGWKPAGTGAGAFALASEGDALVGGNPMSDALRFVSTSPGAPANALVVTTTMTITEDSAEGGSAGIILRVSGDPRKFYLCAVSIRNGAAAARTPDGGCSGDLCAPLVLNQTLADGGADPAAFPVPSEVPHKIGTAIGIRASVTAGSGDAGAASGTFECRVFDPANPATLTSSDPRFAARVDVSGARWYPSGDLGLYAQKSTAVFGSVDVLRGP